jgi:hypothetical protein
VSNQASNFELPKNIDRFLAAALSSSWLTAAQDIVKILINNDRMFSAYLKREMRVGATNRFHLKGLMDALVKLKKAMKPKEEK